MSFPFRVTRTRLAMPFWVLSLGTRRHLFLGGRGALAARRQNHEQVLALQQRLAFDDRELLGIIGHALEDLPPYLLVDHLAAPEHDRHLDLLSSFYAFLQTYSLV